MGLTGISVTKVMREWKTESCRMAKGELRSFKTRMREWKTESCRMRDGWRRKVELMRKCGEKLRET
jgi:hypothetical protein